MICIYGELKSILYQMIVNCQFFYNWIDTILVFLKICAKPVLHELKIHYLKDKISYPNPFLTFF